MGGSIQVIIDLNHARAAICRFWLAIAVNRGATDWRGHPSSSQIERGLMEIEIQDLAAR